MNHELNHHQYKCSKCGSLDIVRPANPKDYDLRCVNCEHTYTFPKRIQPAVEITPYKYNQTYSDKPIEI